jgi:pSer/pThr/pTyr-binding forkhead associated (FHA) protein
MDMSATLSPDALQERLGQAFLVLVSGELAKPSPMQRTATWDDGAGPTSETGFFVAALRPRSPGVRTVSLGRTPNNDIVLVDSTISKVHAFVHRDPQSGVDSITDAESHNGTFVEGARVAPRGEGAPTALRSGQSLQLGSVSLSYLTLDHLLALGRTIHPA